MRVLIFGSRTWKDYAAIVNKLKELPNVECVIEGEAMGADLLGAFAAEQLGIPVVRFPANWKKFGLAAGHIRNQQMIDEGQPTYGIAFWDGKSRGTQDMMRRLEKALIPYEVVT